VETRILSH